MFTKGGCLVAPTVNPECTALHVRHLRIRIIVYSLSYVVKPVRFDIGCIKRNIYLFILFYIHDRRQANFTETVSSCYNVICCGENLT